MATKAELAAALRSRISSHLLDLSGMEPGECAIYTLSDPRNLRGVRYVGQTRSPRRRYAQHLHTARLWLPDSLPWWIKRPELRPLYDWIRQLHRDQGRLPVMAVMVWSQAAEALAEERRYICQHLSQKSALLNREAEAAKQQLLLI